MKSIGCFLLVLVVGLVTGCSESNSGHGDEESIDGDSCLGDAEYVIDSTESMQSLKDRSCLPGALRIVGFPGAELELPNLKTVGGALFISDNPRLYSLRGLGALTSVGMAENHIGAGVTIRDNPELVDLDGLQNVIETNAVVLHENPQLESVAALENLTSVSQLTLTNQGMLQTLQGLGGISSLDHLAIEENPLLDSLAGLENLRAINEYINVHDNAALSYCELCNLVVQLTTAPKPSDSYIGKNLYDACGGDQITELSGLHCTAN